MKTVIVLLMVLLLAGVVYADDRTGVFPIESDECTVVEEVQVLAVTKNGGSGGWCAPKWICSEWSECRPDGKQLRTCADKWECGTLDDLPTLWQECLYEGKNVDIFSAPGNFAKEGEIIVDFEKYEDNEITGAVVGSNSNINWVFPVILVLILTGLITVYLFATNKKDNDPRRII